MFEILFNVKKAERRPWEMFLIGLFYSSVSILLAHFFFSTDGVLSEFLGMIVITFCVMLCMPFMYGLIKKEEREDEEVNTIHELWDAHKDAIYAFVWLFLGFIIAFSFWNIALGDSNLFNAQVQTYCLINNPGDVESCTFKSSFEGMATGAATKEAHLMQIIGNNILVTIFTLIFSLIFGAGAMFILAWNASVIAAAIGIFAKYKISNIPLGIARFMIHGLPELVAYFVTALAGGILGVGIIKHGIKSKKILKILENSAMLIFLSLIIIVIAGVIEVYITPLFFR
jgi:uncharacterized membrane protein SpoIIM required for sporulation